MNKIILTLTISFFAIAAINPVVAQRKTKSPAIKSATDVRYMDMEFSVPATVVRAEPVAQVETRMVAQVSADSFSADDASSNIEQATSLQLKYALLLNTHVEAVSNLNLFSVIDEWLGTRYRMGGEGKSGIDCSAFTKMMYAALFGFALPRTAREQYEASRSVADHELQEGDLLFFNTRGGVSHVGMYLQNGKFVHAASSSGVAISDISDGYWSSRYLGGRRALTSSWVMSKP